MKKVLKVLCVVVVLVGLVSPSFGMTKAQEKACRDIIHSTAIEGVCSAAVMAQAPSLDAMAFVGFVGKMVYQLAQVFDTSLTLGNTVATMANIGTNTLRGSFALALVGRTASQWLVGWIPFIGNAINAASMAGLIEYVGWHVAEQFDAGDFSLLDWEFQK